MVLKGNHFVYYVAQYASFSKKPKRQIHQQMSHTVKYYHWYYIVIWLGKFFLHSHAWTSNRSTERWTGVLFRTQELLGMSYGLKMRSRYWIYARILLVNFIGPWYFSLTHTSSTAMHGIFLLSTSQIFFSWLMLAGNGESHKTGN